MINEVPTDLNKQGKMVSVYITLTNRLANGINRLAYERGEPRTRTIRLLLELGLDAYKEQPQCSPKRKGPMVDVIRFLSGD
jgi:hypothetical protein